MARFNPGTHIGVVTEQGWETTKKAPPRDMIVFKVSIKDRVIVQPDGAEYLEDVSGNSDYDQTVRMLLDPANEKSMEFALKKLRHAGFTGDSIGQLDLVGKEVRVKNDPTQDNSTGKEYDNWDFVLPPLDQPSLAPIDAKKARSLDALFGRKLKETASKPEVPAKPAERVPVSQQEPATVPPDDSVPF